MATYAQMLEHAALGFRVFPLQQGTKDGQLLPSWPRDASADPAQLLQWSRRYPECNIGLVCDGFIVLDVDAASGGLDSLLELLSSLPETREHRSPSGGLHLIYRYDGPALSNTRTAGGYIVGPGSTYSGRAYAVAAARQIAPAPAWLVERLRPRVAASTGLPEGVEPDGPAAVQAASSWLLVQPGAVAGSRNATVYRLAARLHDLGITTPVAERLLIDNWLPRCSPPLDRRELSATVAHAYRYAQNAFGSTAAGALFTDVPDLGLETPPLEPPADQVPMFVSMRDDLQRIRDGAVPPLPWLVPGLALRGHLTAIVAPPGAGKSALELALAVDLAIGPDDAGRGRCLQLPLEHRLRTLIVNVEDDALIMTMRTEALCIKNSIAPADLEDGLFRFNATDEHPYFVAVARDRQRTLRVTRALDELCRFVTANKIDVVCLDPFAEVHEADENANAEIKFVATQLRQAARRTNAAFVIIHHSRKGGSSDLAGNLDAGRGASALAGAARVVRTLFPMSADEADHYGIPEHERFSFVRMDDTKFSYTGRSAVRWLRHCAVVLANGETATALGAADIEDYRTRRETALIEIVADAAAAAGGTAPLPAVIAALRCDPLFIELTDKRLQEAVSHALRMPRELEAGVLSLTDGSSGQAAKFVTLESTK